MNVEQERLLFSHNPLNTLSAESQHEIMRVRIHFHPAPSKAMIHPAGNPGANLESISHRCCLFEIAFVWELTKETIVLPLGCLQGGGSVHSRGSVVAWCGGPDIRFPRRFSTRAGSAVAGAGAADTAPRNRGGAELGGPRP